MDSVACEIATSGPSTNADDATASATLTESLTAHFLETPTLSFSKRRCSLAAGQPAALIKIDALLDFLLEVAAESFQNNPHLSRARYLNTSGQNRIHTHCGVLA